jgi:hypothetical protein
MKRSQLPRSIERKLLDIRGGRVKDCAVLVTFHHSQKRGGLALREAFLTRVCLGLRCKVRFLRTNASLVLSGVPITLNNVFAGRQAGVNRETASRQTGRSHFEQNQAAILLLFTDTNQREIWDHPEVTRPKHLSYTGKQGNNNDKKDGLWPLRSQTGLAPPGGRNACRPHKQRLVRRRLCNNCIFLSDPSLLHVETETKC